MADADEDAIPRSDPSVSTDVDPSYDPEDEAQDFRFLASSLGNNASIPKRGEKDFEPNPTRTQASILNASRQAMHAALSVERIHVPQSTPIGVYLPNEQEWRRDGATDRLGAGHRCVVVERFKGSLNKSIGKEDSRNWTWLLPEEALFLLERGSLDIRWPDEENGNVIVQHEHHHDKVDNCSRHDLVNNNPQKLLAGAGLEQDNERKPGVKSKKPEYTLRVGEMPMSLQGAYATLIGKSGLSLERYIVYAGLRRLGYLVQRAPTWEDIDDVQGPPTDSIHSIDDEAEKTSAPMLSVSVSRSRSLSAVDLVNRLMSWLLVPRPQPHSFSLGPVLSPGIYRTYNDIFRALALVPYSNPDFPPEISPVASHTKVITQAKVQPKPPFKIHFVVNKPSNTSVYKKSTPLTPDFLICVIDARSTSLPTLTQISGLLDSLPPDVLPKEGRKMEVRLKHGRRNAILAVVDSGIVSYLRASDMGFGDEGRVYEDKVRRGVKLGGGRGGGSSRGRGGNSGRGGGRGRGRGG